MEKALPFIDYYKENITGKINLIDSLHSTAKYYHFVTQEFKPEIIVEFFEGFSKSPHSETYHYMEGKIAVQFSGIRMGIHDKNNDLYSTHPLTVNDFLSDAKRAGIKLCYKPEIVNKFLK